MRIVVCEQELEFGEKNDARGGVCLSAILCLENFKEGESGFVLGLEKTGAEGVPIENAAKMRIESKKGMLIVWKSRFVKYTVVG